MHSTSFVLPPAEIKALEQIKVRTGVAKAIVVRRLIAHYAKGNPVEGLPTINPPISNPITR